MLQRISEDKAFLKRVFFSDEATFHVSGKLNKHNVRIWEVRDMTDLKQRISNAIATIDEAMLQQTWQEIEYRLDVLRATNGAHVEVY